MQSTKVGSVFHVSMAPDVQPTIIYHTTSLPVGPAKSAGNELPRPRPLQQSRYFPCLLGESSLAQMPQMSQTPQVPAPGQVLGSLHPSRPQMGKPQTALKRQNGYLPIVVFFSNDIYGLWIMVPKLWCPGGLLKLQSQEHFINVQSNSACQSSCRILCLLQGILCFGQPSNDQKLPLYRNLIL